MGATLTLCRPKKVPPVTNEPDFNRLTSSRSPLTSATHQQVLHSNLRNESLIF